MLGSFSTFMRMVAEEVPQHKGKCQALQNNLLAVTQMVAPMWLSLSYSGERMHREKVPRFSLTCLAATNLVFLAALALSLPKLQPLAARSAKEAAKPLLQG